MAGSMLVSGRVNLDELVQVGRTLTQLEFATG